MKWSIGELSPGDLIRAKVGSVYHYGIFVSEEEVIAFGYPPVSLGAVKDEDVRVVSTDIDVFSAGSFVERGLPEAAEKKKMKRPEEIIRTARERVGEGGYSLLHNNCEHFMNECAFGERRSAQEDEARERWNKRPQMSVFFMKIPESLEVSKVYPPKRNREILFSKNAAVRRERYAVWELLRVAAERSFGYDFESLQFEKSREGKWICDRFEFSLSHTAGACAAVVSDGPCGVDIENLVSRENAYAKGSLKPDRLLEKILTEREKASRPAGLSETEEFLYFWTRKESIFKAYDGKNFYPDRTETGDYPVQSVRLEKAPELMLAVSGKSLPLLALYEVTDGKSRKLSPEEYRLTEADDRKENG